MARKYDIEKVINDISLNVATDFLQVLFNKELVKIIYLLDELKKGN